MPAGHYKRPIRPVVVPIGPSIAYITLNGLDLYARIPRPFARIAENFNWTVWRSRGLVYAYTSDPMDTKWGAKLFLHRWILDAPENMQVDHMDWDGLNNLPHNIRLATRSQNQIHRRKYSESPFTGVTAPRGGKRYTAQITVNRKQIHIGTYDTAEEARDARNAKARELHGGFAVIDKTPIGISGGISPEVEEWMKEHSVSDAHLIEGGK
jgi:HNH endonuclease